MPAFAARARRRGEDRPQWCAAEHPASVTEMLHWTNFQNLASCCSTIVRMFLQKTQHDTGSGIMRQSLHSQIPDTTPYMEWLAIVCPIMMAGLFCAVLFSNVV